LGQCGSRQQLKTCPEPSGNELPEYVFKNLYLVCSPKGYVKHLATSFLEKDEIILLGSYYSV
jgi:hypothetical protein